MAVNIIHDRDRDTACLYCTTTDWAFGPVFTGHECEEQAECWLDWFHDGQAASAAGELRIQTILGQDGLDPRAFHNHDLETLHARWRRTCTNDQGNLIYSHHLEDGIAYTDWAWRTHSTVTA